MRPTLLAALAGGAMSALPVSAGAPPNDDCADAIAVTVGMTGGTTIDATNDGAGGCSSSMTPDVWYSFTSPQDGVLTVSTCGSAYDTVIGIWSGCPGEGEEIVCNDDSCGFQSAISATVSQDQTLLVRVSGFLNATGDFTLTVELDDPPMVGPDALFSEMLTILYWGEVDGIHAYSPESRICNIGDLNMGWPDTAQTYNAFKLADGRLVQIGMSWYKPGFNATAIDQCGLDCNGQGNDVLGVGCMDVYGPLLNGTQGVLGPRADVNAFTGESAALPGGSGDAVARRLQIHAEDLGGEDVLYFYEGIFVAPDDAAWLNAMNNASYKRVALGPGFVMQPVAGSMQAGIPAIYAWRDHGLGPDTPDPSVEIVEVDVPGEGRFHVASKVVDLGDGTWRYEYAVSNLSSHRSAASLSVPFPPGTSVSNAGFHDVDYHSGDPFDNTDWGLQLTDVKAIWSSPATFEEDPDTNALRWATMYNFWLEADAAPGPGPVTIGLFRPGDPSSVTATVPIPGGLACPADVNGDQSVDVSDLVEVIFSWGPCPGCPADIDGDGAVGVSDLIEVIFAWGSCL